MNGTQLDHLNLTNFEPSLYNDEYDVGVLINANLLLEHNTTTIQCIATSSTGTTSQSEVKTLLIQGK